MTSFRRSRVLLLVGLLASSAASVSGCTVDDNGLAEVAEGGPDGSEPDATPPSADGGDATLEGDGEVTNAEGGRSAEAGDGSVAPGTDAEAAAPGVDAGDATASGDAAVDSGRDASVDAGTDTGASDASGGTDGDATNGPGPGDAFGDVVAPEDAGEDGGPDSDMDVVDAGPSATTTTSVITNALSSACADDAFNDGCLSPQCEDLGATATSLCLATLTCALSASTATPYCGMLMDEVDECYCGEDTNFTDCQNGAGDGVCIAAEQNGFGSEDPAGITGSYFDTTTADGVANTIASCLNGIRSCINAAGL